MSQTFGKTRWKRFAVVMVPTIAATAAVGISIAQGALAASFSVSGQQFEVSAGKLHGDNFRQYGTVLDGTKTPSNPSGKDPVAVSGFDSATINQLCQSVDFPVPGLGDFTLRIDAGGSYDATTGKSSGPEVSATGLFISMSDLKADTATFNGMNIGVATGDVGTAAGQTSPKTTFNGGTNPGAFAQTAESADLTGVKQTAWATSAATFTLNGMHLHLDTGNTGCF
ncbi:DUF6230 family protein [Streptacidiphilus sp. PAMC 29251]